MELRGGRARPRPRPIWTPGARSRGPPVLAGRNITEFRAGSGPFLVPPPFCLFVRVSGWAAGREEEEEEATACCNCCCCCCCWRAFSAPNNASRPLLTRFRGGPRSRTPSNGSVGPSPRSRGPEKGRDHPRKWAKLVFVGRSKFFVSHLENALTRFAVPSFLSFFLGWPAGFKEEEEEEERRGKKRKPNLRVGPTPILVKPAAVQ